MSTIHSGKGFILCLRRRYHESRGALVSARRPFDFSLDTDLLNQSQAQTFFRYRVMLPIPLFIDNYNHHMNRADLADQLRAVYCT
jgi:hypothetical protein